MSIKFADLKVLQSINLIAKKHAKQLEKHRISLQLYSPIQDFWLENIDDQNLLVLDGFVLRFLKLQDWICTKIFPQMLQINFEIIDTGSFIDLLNKLEKVGIIESAETWKDIRKLRNNLAHEYPDHFCEIAKNLNQAFEFVPVLLDAVNRFDREVTRMTSK